MSSLTFRWLRRKFSCTSFYGNQYSPGHSKVYDEGKFTGKLWACKKAKKQIYHLLGSRCDVCFCRLSSLHNSLPITLKSSNFTWFSQGSAERNHTNTPMSFPFSFSFYSVNGTYAIYNWQVHFYTFNGRRLEMIRPLLKMAKEPFCTFKGYGYKTIPKAFFFTSQHPTTSDAAELAEDLSRMLIYITRCTRNCPSSSFYFFCFPATKISWIFHTSAALITAINRWLSSYFMPC